MPQGTIAQRFRDAVRNFVLSGGTDETRRSELSSFSRARLFVEEVEPELSRAFLLDYTERAMRADERAFREAAEQAEPDPPQMKFAGRDFAELFKSPRQRLPIQSGRQGRRVPLEQMTVTQIRRSAAIFAKRAKDAASLDQRRARWLTKIAEDMLPIAKVHRGLTYGDYLLMRASGIAPSPAKKVAPAGSA